jgi:hypothetical protein
MTRREVMQAAVDREMATLGPPPRGDGKATLRYIARVYEGADRILRTPLPHETWRERLTRWFG